MNEQEKKAIECLKGMIKSGGTLDAGFERGEEKEFQTVLNLIEKLQRQIKIKDNYMKLILDILYDYDGYFNRETNEGSITDLADLIDETCDFLKSAIENDDKRVMGIGGDEKAKFNILHEKLEG